MIDKIKKFTVDDKNNLLSKTFYVLPDNPSDKHFSPSQIRKKGYEGYLVLFEFLNSVIDAINENVNLSNEDIKAINAKIQEIVTYIEDNKSLIDSKVNVSDIIDNLTSEIANKPVSAKQAFILKGMIDTLTAIVNTKANSTDVYDKNEIDAKINDLNLADIDTDLSLTSTNPIQNKVVSKQIKDINYTIMTMKEELFETILSEIDYKVNYATVYPIPETLSDDDGTHRVVYSDTQLKEIEGNSVAFNQLLIPYNSNLNADYYFCECEDMVLENCSYLKQTGDNYKTDFIDLKCNYGSFHAEAYLGYSAPYEASGRGFVHNFEAWDNSSMTYTFNAPGGGKADLILRGATNIVNTGNYSATALNVGTAVDIELNGVSINHLIKSTDNFVGKSAGTADPQNRNTTHAETGFSLNGRYLYLLWTDVTIKGVNLSVGKNTLKITAKNGSENGHWDSVKFDITPYKNGGSNAEEANKETINGITFTNNGDGSFSVSGTATADAVKVFLSRDWDINHSYLVRGLSDKGIDGEVYWYDNSNGQFSSSKDYIFKPTNTSNNQRKVALMIKSGTTVNFTFFPQVHDLTNMSLDNIKSVEEFNHIFPLTYYPYNVGELLNSKISGVRIRNSKLATVLLNKISVVDLGTLNWNYDSKNKLFFSTDLRNVLIKPKENYSKEYSQLFDSYGYYLTQQSFYEQGILNIKDISVSISPDGILRLRNLAYTDATAFKSAMNGVLLYFECIEPQETISQEVVNEFVNKTIIIPQTELPSAGSVHDTIKFVEGNIVAGQQRYNMVYVSRINNIDLGTFEWTQSRSYPKRWVTYNALRNKPAKYTDGREKGNLLCTGGYSVDTYSQVYLTGADMTVAINEAGVDIHITNYAFENYTAEQVKASLSDIILNYEKAEPTETTIATDLTFEEVSAIIEQGGSIETIFEIVPPNLKTAFVVNKAIVS